MRWWTCAWIMALAGIALAGLACDGGTGEIPGDDDTGDDDAGDDDAGDDDTGDDDTGDDDAGDDDTGWVLDLQDELDAAVAVSDDWGGGVFRVGTHDGDVLWEGASGLAVRLSEEPMTPDVTFEIASTSKAFTAATVLLLVEDGAFGLDDPIGGLLPTAEQVGFEQTASQQHGTVEQIAGLINRTDERGRKEQLPALLLAPEPWNGHVVIWIDAQGKAGLLNDEGAPRPHIARLLVDGSAVVGVDLLYQGEFLPVGEQPPTKTRRVDNPRQFAGYTFGFNHTLFAQRVRDVLTVVSAVRHSEHDPQRVDLVGLGEAGRWVAAARALTGEAVDRTAIDTGGFRFGGVLDLHDVDFLPGGAKYGDLPGMLALTAPGPLWLAGENAELPAPLRAAYSAAGALDRIHIAGQPPSPPDAAVDWLLQDE